MPIPLTSATKHASSRRTALLSTAVTGAVVGLVTMPFLAVSGFIGGGWDGMGDPPLLAALYGAWTDAFRWDSADMVRRAFGRPLLGVCVALLAGLIAWQDTTRPGSRAVHITRGVIGIGFVMTALGNITEAWVANEFLWRVGFGALTIPGLVLILTGSSVLGILMLRSRVSVPAVALSLTLPAGVVNTVVGLHYLPAAPAFAICTVWLMVFAAALGRKETRA